MCCTTFGIRRGPRSLVRPAAEGRIVISSQGPDAAAPSDVAQPSESPAALCAAKGAACCATGIAEPRSSSHACPDAVAEGERTSSPDVGFLGHPLKPRSGASTVTPAPPMVPRHVSDTPKRTPGSRHPSP